MMYILAYDAFYRPSEKEISIYVGLTEMQRKWYRSVLEKDKDVDAVNGILWDLI